MGLHRCPKHGNQTGPLCCRHVIDATDGMNLQDSLVHFEIDWLDDGTEISEVVVCTKCAAAASIRPNSTFSAVSWVAGSENGNLPWVAPTCHVCVNQLRGSLVS